MKKEATLTNQEYTELLDEIPDIETFAEIFYDGDLDYLLEDNPFIIEKLTLAIEAYPDEVISYLESNRQEKALEEYEETGDPYDLIDGVVQYSNPKKVILEGIYDNDIHQLFEDNPFVLEELIKYWKRNSFPEFKKALEEWAEGEGKILPELKPGE